MEKATKKVINNKKGTIKINFDIGDKVTLKPGENNIEKEDYARISKVDYFKALIATGLVKVETKEIKDERKSKEEPKKKDDSDKKSKDSKKDDPDKKSKDSKKK